MTMFLAPYTALNDLDGSPLDAGFIYFGEYGKDPELFPVEVFWDADFTVPAAQPIRTRNGYPVRNGSPAKVYLKTAQHSIVIKNGKGAFVLVDFLNKGLTASLVVDASGKTQQEINSKTIFLSDYITEPAIFFAAQEKNRVVDVFELLTTDTINFQGSLDFKNLEIKASSNFPANKQPMLVLSENCFVQNLILNGDSKNVRGASLNSSNISIKNLTIKNTQYLALEGISEVDKFNLDLDNILLENVCISGVAGDLGYGGLAIERSFNGSFNNITVDSCGAKAFRLRYSKNNTGRKHNYNDVREDQAALYLASGENNNISEVVVTNTRNCIKMSRGEKNSKVDFLDLDNSHITDATYTVALILQGTQDCEVSNMNIRKGNGFAIRVEPHPMEIADPYAEQPSYRNKLKNVTVDSVGSGELLYSVRSSGLLEISGNEYDNITLKGNDVATSGITLIRSAGTKMSNVSVLDVVGADLAASDSDLNFKDGAFTSNNDTSSRKLSLTGASSISIENTKIDGVTTDPRYLSANLTSGKFQLINCADVTTTSSDIGLYIIGDGTTCNLISNNLKGNRVVIGSNISGGVLANNITEQDISNASTAVIVSNNVTPNTTSLTLKNQSLPASTGVAVGATINTAFTITGVKLGDIVRVTPVANTNVYDTVNLVGVVSSANTVMVKRKNTTSAPLDMGAMSINIKIERL